ncbi:HBR071Wp [Eremothecium sinecaudum]|uniref:HBR071Wp n=1 Tax=Eremothecium sinecaudum TaxID=45286 RepID=A0A109UX76_9SACH|nr:HBR071Wp [Eremothecium sinecaudum]AMD18972.1 HBR071Wp [Eremothecium sinecaudum]
MRAHKLETVLIRENVRLELLYESNPFFAGEPISLVIKFQHLGSVQGHKHVVEKLEALRNKRSDRQRKQNDSTKSWVRSLWNPVNLEEKLLEENEGKSISELEKQLEYNKATELLSYYIQLYGSLKFDASVVDASKLQPTRKIVGLGLKSAREIPEAVKSSPSPLSHLVNTDLNDNNKGLHQIGSYFDEAQDTAEIPLLIIPQTLMFTELTLQPGEQKVFLFKSARLPKSLPPSYSESKRFNISYRLQIGGMTDIESVVKSVLFNFPLNISSYVDRKGFQYISQIGQETSFLSPGSVRELDESKRKRSMHSMSTFSRHRHSVDNIYSEVTNNLEKASKLKKHFKSLLIDSKGDLDLDNLIGDLMSFQFGKNYKTDMGSEEDLSRLLGAEDTEPMNIQDQKTLIKDNPISSGDNSAATKEVVNNIFQNLKREFVVNKNGTQICSIELSKTYHYTGEDIDLLIHLVEGSKHKVTAITTALEVIESLNPDYCINNNNQSKVKSTSRCVYENHYICFEEISEIPIKLLSYRSPSDIPVGQFETNIFDCKWMISFRFVIIDREDMTTLVEFYEDKKGKLWNAKEQLHGEEFTFRLPVTVVSTEKQFGGW